MKNLLAEIGTVVETTRLTRKLTIDGVTKIFPVYRVRLDQLYYNDQNDRIASWISQYKSEHGSSALSEISRELYNEIIERFVIESNEAAIEKTQLNIQLVKQREPGVILTDGRIIDGNRRFTCLRRLSQSDDSFNWFETVIIDANIENGKKQIKMLELAIQHGEEKKVDYNPIDRLVGVYQDIVETGLLTVEEYAYSTNESVFEVKKRIESAYLLVEFLEFINMPTQWHIAREYQVVSVISDLQPLLRKCSTVEMRQKTKEAVFTNIMMRTIGDSRTYIRNLGQMMDSGFFAAYLKDQEKIGTTLREAIDEAAPESKQELESFVSAQEDAAEDLQMSLDRSLLKARKRETRNRPSQIVSKSVSLLKGVDTNIFEKLTESEKDNFRGQLDRLSAVVDRFDTIIDVDETEKDNDVSIDSSASISPPEEVSVPVLSRLFIAERHLDEPFVHCLSAGTTISNLGVTLEFMPEATPVSHKRNFTYKAYFLDAAYNRISDVYDLDLVAGTLCRTTFVLSPKVSASSQCLLALQSSQDKPDELQQLIPFEINITFKSDFDF